MPHKTTVMWVMISGCVFIAGGRDEGPDCVSVAITDAAGDPDGCDLAACVTCAETCGSDCLIQESYPPQYSCGDEGAWSVEDFCPDWQPPSVEPSATHIADLGCGESEAEAIIAVAEGQGQIAVTHEGFATGCCPASVEVGVDRSGAVLVLDYIIPSDDCDCVCQLDVSYDIVDVPAGVWTLIAEASGVTASVTVP